MFNELTDFLAMIRYIVAMLLKLTFRAIRYWDGWTDPRCRNASLSKSIRCNKIYLSLFYLLTPIILFPFFISIKNCSCSISDSVRLFDVPTEIKHAILIYLNFISFFYEIFNNSQYNSPKAIEIKKTIGSNKMKF